MTGYTPELVLGIASTVYNIAVVVTAGLTVAKLYEHSHSWHSLWALLILVGLKSFTFIRD